MKVLFWSEAFFPDIGGIEVFAVHLMTALSKRGYEFAVVTSLTSRDVDAEQQFSENVRIYRFPFRAALTRRDLQAIKQLHDRVAQLKQALRPDLIHLNSTLPSVFFHIQTSKHCPLPSLVTLHIPRMDARGAEGLTPRIIRSADRIVAVSQAVFEEACRLQPEVRDRVRLVHNSLPMTAVAPAVPPSNTLLCLGRLTRQKGFDVALEAFSQVLAMCPGARLRIVGDGEERVPLENQAARLGISEAVEFTGWVQPEKVAEVITGSAIVLMPSRYEPFGLVALQAAQMARPVIASRVGGLQEVIADNQTGLLIDKENAGALAEATVYLLERPELCSRLGQAARSRVVELFDFERFADAYDQLYQEVASLRKEEPSPSL